MSIDKWTKGRTGEKAAALLLLNNCFAVKKPEFDRDYKEAIDLYIQEPTGSEWEPIQIKHNLQIREDGIFSFLQKDIVDRPRKLKYKLTLTLNEKTDHYTAYLLDIDLLKMFYEQKLKKTLPQVNKEYVGNINDAPSHKCFWKYSIEELIEFCKTTNLDVRTAVRKFNGNLG